MSKSVLNKNRVPTLRFPGFSNSWTALKLKDVSETFLDGDWIESKDQSESGFRIIQTGNIGVGQFLDKSDRGRFISESKFQQLNCKEVYPNDLLISRLPAPIGRSCLVPASPMRYVTSVDCTIVRVKNEKILPKFLLQITTTDNYFQQISQMTTGSTRERISRTNLGEISLAIPSIAEQNKVSAFLEDLNRWIENLKAQKMELEGYKRGVTQKIFSQELRFEDENGKNFPEWEKVRLKDVFGKRSVRNSDSSVKDVLTNSATRGIVNQRDYFDKDIANQDNLTNYYVVEKDDFIYNPRISSTAPVGPLKRNKNGRGVMSPLYTVLTLTKGDLGFYEYYFDTNLWHRYMYIISNFGARHDRMNIRDEDFMKMPLPYPSEAEQKKIASFVSSLDVLIEAKTKQVELAESWKKGLLQKMFV